MSTLSPVHTFGRWWLQMAAKTLRLPQEVGASLQMVDAPADMLSALRWPVGRAALGDARFGKDVTVPFIRDFTFMEGGHGGCSHHQGSPISFFRLLKFFFILSWYLFP